LTRQGWWGDDTLHELFWHRVAEHPELLAVADQPNRDAITTGAPCRFTYAEGR